MKDSRSRQFAAISRPTAAHGPPIAESTSIVQVAEMLGRPTGTLANWRYQGRGPAFVKIGRHVRNRRSDVAGWAEERVVPAGGQ